MQAGKFTERISIEQRNPQSDSVGQRKLVWITYAKVWADVLLQNGKGSFEAGREASIVSGSMRIRKRGDITPDMRVLWGGRIFDIKAIIPKPDGRRDCIDLVVETGGNNG